jgi:hypothetical protein
MFDLEPVTSLSKEPSTRMLIMLPCEADKQLRAHAKKRDEAPNVLLKKILITAYVHGENEIEAQMLVSKDRGHRKLFWQRHFEQSLKDYAFSHPAFQWISHNYAERVNKQISTISRQMIESLSSTDYEFSGEKARKQRYEAFIRSCNNLKEYLVSLAGP